MHSSVGNLSVVNYSYSHAYARPELGMIWKLIATVKSGSGRASFISRLS